MCISIATSDDGLDGKNFTDKIATTGNKNRYKIYSQESKYNTNTT